MNKQELMIDLLCELEFDIVEIWNSYCMSSFNGSEKIYYMGDLDANMSDLTPTEIIESIDNAFST